MKAILAQGRELGIALWALTQRPSTIPQIAISESTHVFVFELNLPQDRKKMVDTTGFEELEEKPGEYNFWYVDVATGKYPVLARLKENTENVAIEVV
jgi:DNA helicase HerA-like ATPase